MYYNSSDLPWQTDTCLGKSILHSNPYIHDRAYPFICNSWIELFNLCQSLSFYLKLMIELFNSSEASIVKRKRKEDDHDILSGASLSKLTAHAEEKIAQSLSSPLPYFVKIIKAFNVSGSRTIVSCSLL